MPPERGRAPLLLALGLLLAAWAAPGAARADGGRGLFSETAAMTRGPAGAPVTIVEFSDYQ